MMLRNETWMVALDALWANKVRAFLTTLGVVIGSACIVLVVTVALSGRRYVIQQIEGVGSNLVYARLVIDQNRERVDLDIRLAEGRGIGREGGRRGVHGVTPASCRPH